MKVSLVAARSFVGICGMGMAFTVPAAPALAKPSCYDAVLFCKYHHDGYASFQECVEEETMLRCPSGSAVSYRPATLEVAKTNALPGETGR